MNGVSPRARLISSSTRREGGAFFHTRRRAPKTSASSISNIEPGAVNAAWASAIVGTTDLTVT